MILTVLVAGPAIAALFGFLALGRYNRERSALIIFGLETLVLTFIVTRYALAVQSFDRVALALAANLQLLYIGLSIFGWFVGRMLRAWRLG